MLISVIPRKLESGDEKKIFDFGTGVGTMSQVYGSWIAPQVVDGGLMDGPRT